MSEIPYPEPMLTEGEVLLRPFTRADIPTVTAACQHPSIARFSPVIPYPYAEEDAREWIEDMLEPDRLAGRSMNLAVARAGSEELLGAIGIHHIEWILRSADIGYWLAVEARGHGYVTTGVRLLARWTFEELGFERIAMTIDPENHASQGVADRCGFRREGLLRSHMLVRHSGERRDSIIYGLLPDELP